MPLSAGGTKVYFLGYRHAGPALRQQTCNSSSLVSGSQSPALWQQAPKSSLKQRHPMFLSCRGAGAPKSSLSQGLPSPLLCRDTKVPPQIGAPKSSLKQENSGSLLGKGNQVNQALLNEAPNPPTEAPNPITGATSPIQAPSHPTKDTSPPTKATSHPIEASRSHRASKQA